VAEGAVAAALAHGPWRMTARAFRRGGGQAGVAVHAGIFGRNRVHGLRQGNILALGVAAGRMAGDARLLDAGVVTIHAVERPFVQAVVKRHGRHDRRPFGPLRIQGRKRHPGRRDLVGQHHARGSVHGHDGGAGLKAGQGLKARLVMTGGAVHRAVRQLLLRQRGVALHAHFMRGGAQGRRRIGGIFGSKGRAGATFVTGAARINVWRQGG